MLDTNVIELESIPNLLMKLKKCFSKKSLRQYCEKLFNLNQIFSLNNFFFKNNACVNVFLRKKNISF
jgi:hypothetical protein